MSQTKAQLLGPLVGDNIDVEGDLNFDSGTFKVDPTNDRIGIKNSNPTKTLDVGGDTQVADLYYTADYPTIRPSLDLVFDKVKRLDSRVTFTRTSTATYVDENGIIQNAAIDEPRFDHDPITGESLGLLIEEQRTNLYPTSEDITAAGAGAVGSRITKSANTAVAPDGNTTADSYIETANNATWRWMEWSASYTSGTTYTFSSFVKPGTGNWGVIYFFADNGVFNGATSTFNLTTGVVDQTGTNTTCTIEEYPNGWYRISATQTASASSTGYIALGFSYSADITTSVAGSTSNTLGYVWGLQTEAGSFPTSYIPTSGSTVTRTYDAVSMNGTNFTNWYNQTEGTIFFNFKTGDYVPATDGMRLFRIANSSNVGQNRVDYVVSTSGSYQPYLRSNTVEYYDGASDIGFTTNTDFNIALTIKENDIYGYINGSLSTEDTTFSTFTADQIDLGSIDGGSSVLNGHISRFTYYPRRLNNSQLQNITL